MNTFLKDKIRGSLVGGAIGDALGYQVEFMSRKSILRKYGPRGVTKFHELNEEGKAVISDDTQMTLFTANGLLFGVTRFCTHGGLGAGLKDYVEYAYQDWLQTQNGVENYDDYHYCWIRDIKELNVRRAPGNTCLTALTSLKVHQPVENDSKGCGGIMRVAPVGLMAAADESIIVKDYNGEEVSRREWTETEVARLGGDCAQITHKHPLGYLPAAFLADLVYYIVMYDATITFSLLEEWIWCVYDDLKKEYSSPREQEALEEMKRLLELAVSQAGNLYVLDEFAIPKLGEGWTGDEALAIAIYCCLKHLDNFEDAMIAAVNHDGDSDSTGAICGNLLGAIIGYDDLPSQWLSDLELEGLIVDIADDIVRGCTFYRGRCQDTKEDKIWEQRYVQMIPIKSLPLWDYTDYYSVMPEAKRMINIKELFKQLESATSDDIMAMKGYAIALQVFDTKTFEPNQPLPYHGLVQEPKSYYFNRSSMPVYLYGFKEDDPVPYPVYFGRLFRFNTFAFASKGNVVAIRRDGETLPITLYGGIKPYSNPEIERKYPLWKFFELDCMHPYVFFSLALEKEYAVEIAHLQEDGSLRRIYHLCW